MHTDLIALAQALGKAALKQNATVATAESCTAGGIAFMITEVAGSSDWFDRGFEPLKSRAFRR